MKKKVLEYQDIEFIQWVLDNVTNVDAFDNERTLYNVDALKYKLIAIRAQMEKEKSNQSKQMKKKEKIAKLEIQLRQVLEAYSLLEEYTTLLVGNSEENETINYTNSIVQIAMNDELNN